MRRRFRRSHMGTEHMFLMRILVHLTFLFLPADPPSHQISMLNRFGEPSSLGLL
jgi:hypothetical protein